MNNLHSKNPYWILKRYTLINGFNNYKLNHAIKDIHCHNCNSILFKEIHKAGKKCAFSPCSHTHEPTCNVKTMVEKGKIALTRYQSYLTLIEGVREDYE
jgi:putative ribosome biogenesis GTPase RsgA